MTAKLFTLPKQTPFSNAGALIPGAKAYFYLNGTSTPQDTYTASDLLTANPNPVVADGNGVFPAIYLDDTLQYKVKITDAADVELYTEDDFILDPVIQYDQTADELAAGVTPSNYQYEPADIRRYGAVVDGVTDDYSAINNALSAYDYAVFPKGTTVTGTTITLTNGQRLVGSGWRQSEITADTGLTTSVVVIDDRGIVQDLKINGTGSKGTTDGIKTADTAARFRISNVVLNNCVNGLNLQACWIANLDNLEIQSCTDGIYVNNEDNYDDPVNGINIIGGEIRSCSQSGIHFERGAGGAFQVNNFNIYGMSIEPSGTYGIWNEDVTLHLVNVDGVYFEACGDAIYRDDGGNISAMIFKNCLFDIDNNAATDKGIDMTGGTVENITVQSCRFTRMSGSSATDGINLGAGSSVANLTLIGNAWTDSALGIVNNGSTVITSWVDEEFGTRLNESLYLYERGSAPADSAGYGQFWIKNDTPNRPRYEDDAGGSHHVAISDGGTGGAGSAGAGNQYIEIEINGNVYKVLHDGTV